MTVTIAILALLLVTTAVGALLLAAAWHAERRRGELAKQHLGEQQVFTQRVLDAIPLPVMVRDRRGALRWANQSWSALSGLDAPRLPELAGDDTAGSRMLLKPSRSTTTDQGVEGCREIAFDGNDGSERQGLAWDVPLLMPGGRTSGVVTTVLDTTDFHTEVSSIRALEEHLNEVSAAIPLIAFAAKREPGGVRRLIFATGDVPAMFGLDIDALSEPDGTLRDWPFQDRVHPEDVASLRQALAPEGPLQLRTLEFRAYGRDGLRWIHLAMAPKRLMHGGSYWAGYLLDTTHLNAHNEVLRSARDAAERASKAKADFLATMSHEIRTPMSGVMGMLELLGSTELDSGQRELLEAVEDSAGVLLKVLNDVLDFARLEAGELKLDPQLFDPRAWIDKVLGSMSAQAHMKGLKVRAAVGAEVAGKLLGDGLRLSQVLLNLLGNAIKFTERGSVAVQLRVDGDDGGSQRLRLSVSDTGVGIAEAEQPRLFAPFVQASERTARHHGGTGLGLAVCRRLVQLMDGQIDLVSKPGEGTTVTVELRLPIAHRVAMAGDLSGRHAVVRLHDSELAAALCDQLAAIGISAESIPPGQTLRPGMSASLLFIDIEDHTSEHAVAARVVHVVDEPATSVTAGKDEHPRLSIDPLRRQTILRACRQALEMPDPDRATSPARITRAPAHGSPILVADDHPVSRTLVQRQLALLGWECALVADGEAALQALRQRSYAMLLTDCNMPVMDGYELALQRRTHEREHGMPRLPIVAMTAHAVGSETLRCREAGMDDVLSKPVQLAALDALLQRWLTHMPPVPATEMARHAPLMQNEAVREAMYAACVDDLAALRTAWTERQPRLIQQKLHRLAGAIQLFTDGPLAGEGRRLLDALHEDSAPQALAALDLPGYLAHVSAWLETHFKPAKT